MRTALQTVNLRAFWRAVGVSPLVGLTSTTCDQWANAHRSPLVAALPRRGFRTFEPAVVCARIESMLSPQFTIRRLLTITSVFAVIFFVGTFASRDQAWAVAITATIGSLVLGFISYLGFFVVTWVFASVAGVFETKRPNSPFARGPSTPPILPPEGPV